MGAQEVECLVQRAAAGRPRRCGDEIDVVVKELHERGVLAEVRGVLHVGLSVRRDGKVVGRVVADGVGCVSQEGEGVDGDADDGRCDRIWYVVVVFELDGDRRVAAAGVGEHRGRLTVVGEQRLQGDCDRSKRVRGLNLALGEDGGQLGELGKEVAEFDCVAGADVLADDPGKGHAAELPLRLREVVPIDGALEHDREVVVLEESLMLGARRRCAATRRGRRGRTGEWVVGLGGRGGALGGRDRGIAVGGTRGRKVANGRDRARGSGVGGGGAADGTRRPGAAPVAAAARAARGACAWDAPVTGGGAPRRAAPALAGIGAAALRTRIALGRADVVRVLPVRRAAAAAAAVRGAAAARLAALDDVAIVIVGEEGLLLLALGVEVCVSDLRQRARSLHDRVDRCVRRHCCACGKCGDGVNMPVALGLVGGAESPRGDCEARPGRVGE